MSHKSPMPPVGLLVAALITGVYRRDWALLEDLIVVLRRGLGIVDVPPLSPSEMAALKLHLHRVARAANSGLELPGCGDPDCDGCMPEVIRDPLLEELELTSKPEAGIIQVQMLNGDMLQLDTPPNPGMHFILCPPVPGWH